MYVCLCVYTCTVGLCTNEYTVHTWERGMDLLLIETASRPIETKLLL
jgi:hypothetical protein